MQIIDVKSNVDDLWDDASSSWQDAMSKKYKAAVIDQMETLLNSMQSSCSQLVLASEDALKQLKEMQE
jgi:flagellar hook-associated protein FlgK